MYSPFSFTRRSIASSPKAPMPHPSQDSPRTDAAQFTTTHWTVVLSVQAADPSRASESLEELCRTYWYPLYAYLRRRGFTEHDAKDLTQGFFAQLFAHQSLHKVAREKGKFRSFLLASLNYFLADEHDRAKA